MSTIGNAVADLLGVGVSGVRPVGGGCIAEASRVTLDDGRVVFAKRLPAGSAGTFDREAADLRHLGEVAATLPADERIDAPAVISATADVLVLEWLPLDQATRVDGADWGRRLAATHRAAAAHPRAAAEQPADFPAYWRDRHLAPWAARVGDRRVADETRRVMDRIDTLLAGAAAEPCLVHGDLWSGNYAAVGDKVGDRRVWFDPAVHAGSREAEFGMTRMFGGFGGGFEAAYHDAYPLPAGFAARADVYELRHHLVHLALFGDSYRAGCERLLSRILAR